MANADVAADFYERWNATKGGGDAVDAAMDLFTDETRFFSAGAGGDGVSDVAFTAPRSGRDEIRRYFDQLRSSWTMNHYTVNELMADGDWVVAVCDLSWTNNATGKAAAGRKVDVWRFQNGKVSSFEEYYDPSILRQAAQP